MISAIRERIRRARLGLRSRRLNKRSARRVIAPPEDVEELLSGFEALERSEVATNEWKTYVRAIVSAFREGPPESFLRFPIVRHALHPNVYRLAARYLEALRNEEIWKNTLSERCVESRFGNPYVDPSRPDASPTLIQHCYHLFRILDGCRIPLHGLGCFLEFGGGYGSTARLLKNLEFEGRYAIYDLPQMVLLQKFYLKNVFRDRLEADATFLANVDWISGDPGEKETARRLDSVGRIRPSVFMATYSLSETPLEFREIFLPRIENFDFAYIAYQESFDAVDNVAYFGERLPRVETHDWDFSACSICRGTRYAFGVRKDRAGATDLGGQPSSDPR